MSDNPTTTVHAVEYVAVAALKPHPRNYKKHPPEQLAHIVRSIEDHGFYRNVVVARDNTILAGHGVVQAVQSMGLFGPERVPVTRLDIDADDPRALKVMAGDNELGALAETNDRVLTELLRDVLTAGDLLGTGFDEQSLAALVYVSRPLEEVRTKNEAAEWVGMPEFDPGDQLYRMIVMFATEEDRDAFIEQTGINPGDRNRAGTMCSGWWPPRISQDRGAVLFVDDDDTVSTITPRTRK